MQTILATGDLADLIDKWCELKAIEAELKGELEKVKNELEGRALEAFFESHGDAADSMRLTTQSGKKIRVTVQRAFCVNKNAAPAVFEKLGLDPGYLEKVKEISFDKSAFIVDGKFSEDLFDEILGAIESAGRKYGKKGLVKVSEKVQPTAEFCEKRWELTAGLTPAQQLELHNVLGSKVLLVS